MHVARLPPARQDKRMGVPSAAPQAYGERALLHTICLSPSQPKQIRRANNSLNSNTICTDKAQGQSHLARGENPAGAV
jgi:hypothetical protein